jgi:hypothetical protein
MAKEKTRMIASLQKDEGRLEEVKAQVAEGMDGLDRAARMREEFPEDEQANIDLEVAEARLDAITGAGDQVLAENAVTAEEEPAFKDIIQDAKEQRAYNSLWLECKTLFTNGETDELALMMETIQEAFEEQEQAYNEALENNADNVSRLGAALDKALITYNASLNIQFELEELRDQEANKLDLELSDEVNTEIRATVDVLKDDKVQLDQRLKHKFRELQGLRGELVTKPDDLALATATAVVDKEYATYKTYVAAVRVQE